MVTFFYSPATAQKPSGPSPTILASKAVGKKGMGATKVSSDFFAEWDMDEEVPEEEEVVVEQVKEEYFLICKKAIFSLL